jgi:hypothetical protein
MKLKKSEIPKKNESTTYIRQGVQHKKNLISQKWERIDLIWHLTVQWGMQRANCHIWHDIWQYNREYRGQIVTLDMTFGSTMGNTEGKLPHLTWHLAVQRGIQRANCHTWQHVIIILLFNNKNRYDTVFEHYGLIDWFIVFNTTFSNISAISWRPVLVVEEAGVPGENHRPWVSNW